MSNNAILIDFSGHSFRFAVPVSHALSAESFITSEKLKNRKVLFIRRGWNKYIDDLRSKLEIKGVTTEDFEMFNISAYNRAVTGNLPIITVEGWEDVHPLLKLIPADWEDSVPFGVFYSPTPTKLVKKFVGLLNSVAAKKHSIVFCELHLLVVHAVNFFEIPFRKGRLYNRAVNRKEDCFYGICDSCKRS